MTNIKKLNKAALKKEIAKIQTSIKKYKTEDPMQVKTTRLANQMYKAFKSEKNRDCGKLVLQWAKDKFWYKVLQDVPKIYDEIYTLLKKHKFTNINRFTYGDIDQGVWIEPCKVKDRLVYVSERYCAMNDDNTYLYIKDWQGIKCVSAWKREKKCKYTKDVDYPSLFTYRNCDFNFGYGDFRDHGYHFTYDVNEFTDSLKDAYAKEMSIPYVYETMVSDLEALRAYDKGEEV